MTTHIALPRPVVELRDVVRAYPTPEGELLALAKVSLAIDAGEVVAIVGRSGSGKSTLVNLVAGIDRPTAGSVVVAGTLLADLGESALAAWRGRTVGLVFQFFQLLPTLSVLENVMLPMDFCGTYFPAAARARARELLEQVGIADQADKLPAALSGGQQQRAAIARALANDPPLVVADEPTGNLDSHTGAEILAEFQRLNREEKQTIILVTHDLTVARAAARTVTVQDGLIKSDIVNPHPLEAEDAHSEPMSATFGNGTTKGIATARK